MLFPENKIILSPRKNTNIKQGLDIDVILCQEIMFVVLRIKALYNIREIFIRSERTDPDDRSHRTGANHMG